MVSSGPDGALIRVTAPPGLDVGRTRHRNASIAVKEQSIQGR
jgi:hypothetical protein